MTGGGGRTVALTGATGFLGSHIADRLLAAGWQVRAAVRPTSNLRWLAGKPLDTVVADLADPDSCRRLVAGCAAVIHCAGVVSAGSEEAYRRGNVDTTRTLLEAAAEVWAPRQPAEPVFVLISSLAAHGPAGLRAPATEESPCRPLTAYGRSKLAAEELVTGRPWPFRTAILRPPGLYGPRDRDFVPLFRAARLGWTVRVGRKLEGLSLVDGRDAAAAAVALLECPEARGVFFVDDGHAGYDWAELAAALSGAVGRRVRVLPLPLGLLKMAAAVAGRGRAARSPVLNPDRRRDLDSPGWVCDGARLRQVTGFRAAFDLATGFQDTVRNLSGQGQS